MRHLAPLAHLLLQAAKSGRNAQPLSVDVERAPRVNLEPALHSRRLLWNAFRRPDPQPDAPPPDDGLGAVAVAPGSSLRVSYIIAMPCADPPNRRHSLLSQGPSVNGWGNREYAIGFYHAPYREERAP